MKENIGRLDSAIRVCIGMAIIILGAYLNTMWGLAGMIPIITTQIGICPIYFLLGINTNHKIKKV